MARKSKKQQWKIVLLLLAAAISGVTLWYTNNIAKKIRNEEKSKVELWHNAIRKKEELVALTTVLFDSLRKEETTKAAILASAFENINNANGDLTFEAKVLELNTSIPLVIVNEDGELSLSKNIDETLIEDPADLKKVIAEFESEHKPIDVEGFGLTMRIYYSNSAMYKELKNTIDNLVNSFFSETVINTASVPVIVTDSTQNNIEFVGRVDTLKNNANDVLNEMKSGYEPIVIRIPGRPTQYIYYADSETIEQLKWFPYLLLTLVGVFLLIAYILFSTFRKSEQNQVWVGMAKETAHQLGTPLSALMAWRDLFEAEGISKELITEFNKDIDRLSTITERFSKIGSETTLLEIPATDLVKETLNYLSKRISSEVKIQISENTTSTVLVNAALFSWVIENLVKNSVDAMEAKGTISVRIHDHKNLVFIDVQDSGKGILKRKWKSIFEPGYTTKERGWGLGLSLAKRIVNTYHKGKISVVYSEIGKGTTIRIALKKAR